MKKIFLVLIAQLFLWNADAATIDTGAIKSLPMQAAGRLKPYDTFARESLMLIYGKSKFQGRSAHEIILTWFLLPDVWQTKAIVQIKRNQIKEALRIDKSRNHFSPSELFANDRLPLIFQELNSQRQMGIKLDPYFQAVSTLENQMGLFRSIVSGHAFRVVPPKEGDTWISLADEKLPPVLLEKFKIMTNSFILAMGLVISDKATDAEIEKAQKEVDMAAAAFVEASRAENPTLYASSAKISWEVHYNSLDPFKWSWIIYLLGTLLLGFAWYTGSSGLYKASWWALSIGFLLHTYAFGLRVYIAERPPVSNMYETVVWVSWGGILFSMIIEAIYKQRYILLCGGIGAILCLIIASFAPAILDPAINPLEPVLVSNFWLLIHVLTITISYSAFLLAFVLGDIGLAFAIRDEKKHADKIRGMADAIYRATQIGVVLLAAGIILGGIWADYSWGRFWGWDPKETWALIALLGYIAILHGRLAGWLRPFGMNASAVVAFSLVIMAWYGVNFVLGAGLHSYGFGGGGVQYVSGFVGLHIVYVVYAVLARQKVQRQKTISQ